jgi:hypothetical protein
MKGLRLLLFVLILIGCSKVSKCQKKCQFNIDTVKILNNINLDKLLQEFQSDSFRITNNKKDIPRFIKKQLKCWTNGFAIANPGEPFQASDVILKRQPKRQLVFLAVSKKMLVMTYLKGGFGLSSRAIFIKFENKKIIDVWCGICLNGMDSKNGIIESIMLENAGKRNLSVDISF